MAPIESYVLEGREGFHGSREVTLHARPVDGFEAIARLKLLEALKHRVLLGDGAMGTQLQQAGLPPGGCGEALNLDAPETILAIQRAYVDAGSDCLITNSFGASRIMLERHDEEGRVREINRAAVEIARRAFSLGGGREG